MRLYSGSSEQFVTDTTRNQITEKLRQAFFGYFRFYPSPGEVKSWQNSLRAMSLVITDARLDDHGVLLEYQLPMTSKRLDFLICGKDNDGNENAIIVELKQWEACQDSEDAEYILTAVGGGEREMLHPSVQVGGYATYLKDYHEAFHPGNSSISLSACSYLHNYSYAEGDPLLAEKFKPVVREFPIFSADDVLALEDHLTGRLGGGDGLDTLARIEKSKYRPSKKLMEHLASVIKGNKEFTLLDEQMIVYQRVLADAKHGFHDKKKRVILVKGGPGTGKTVIAMNLLADYSQRGYNTQYVSHSKSFMETARKVLGRRAAAQLRYTNAYMHSEANEVDVMVLDEAHRIRESSNIWTTPKERRSKKTQIQELIDASKVSVFFIDDYQVVKPDEVGSSVLIEEYAKKHGCELRTYELEAQFRCQGSDAFVNWINNTLGIAKTANVIWTGHEGFEFKVFDNPFELEKAIRQKHDEGFKARMVAGFCWPWSKPKADGTLEDDVVIDEFKRPWNARNEGGRLAKGIPKSMYWATDPNGINQIGCVYTAQGFDLDYVGVIFGPDLRYNFGSQQWEGHPEDSKDKQVAAFKEKFTELVKNTYRVLFSRGMKGCYVYFVDQETKNFVSSRIEEEL